MIIALLRLLPQSYETLKELIEVLNDYPKLEIEIQGHVCCQLPHQYDAVSTDRAKAIYIYLIKNGISKNRLSFKGYGVSRPVHPIPEMNTLEEEDNKRVEILVVNR